MDLRDEYLKRQIDEEIIKEEVKKIKESYSKRFSRRRAHLSEVPKAVDLESASFPGNS